MHRKGANAVASLPRRTLVALAALLSFIQPCILAQSSPIRARRYELGEIRLSLERTRCLGSCPIYSVTLSGDGRVVYRGTDHVAVTGIQETAISDDDLIVLVNEFLRAHFFDAKDAYRERELISLEPERKYLLLNEVVTDRPSTILSLKLGDREKRVILYHNYPAELYDLAGLVDRMSGVTKWVTAPSP